MGLFHFLAKTHFDTCLSCFFLLLAGKENEVYDKLKRIPNLHVHWKKDIPAEYHYTYNRRIMPIVIEAAEGYNLCQDHTCPVGGM